MSSPYFSIMLPIKGRAGLARDALASLLQQDFRDFEVLVSNNGGDPAVTAALAPLLADSRVLYVEQPQVLDMPNHWETVSKLASGGHFMVLPDRSVLRQGALAEIWLAHEQFENAGEIVSWPWDLYFEDANLLVPHLSADGVPISLPSEESLMASLSGLSKYPYSLPRGLNSSVSTSLLERMRSISNTAFGVLNPDFSFAYRCLLLKDAFIYIPKPLMISQGLSVSNGGTALRGDASRYFLTLNLSEPFIYAPSKAMLVENGIFEDFLKSAHTYGRLDLIESWDRTSYYIRCFNEISEKRRARLVPASYVATLQAEVEAALQAEPDATRLSVYYALRSGSPMGTIRRFLRHLLPDSVVTILRPHILRLKGAKRYKSVLHAAGFAGRS
jgi:hypothetical protein